MNTIEQEIRSRLEAMGLRGERLDACMECVKAHPSAWPVYQHWDDLVDSEEASIIVTVLWWTAQEIVSEWQASERRIAR